MVVKKVRYSSLLVIYKSFAIFLRILLENKKILVVSYSLRLAVGRSINLMVMLIISRGCLEM